MPRAMYVVHVEVDPKAEGDWAAWQFGSHVPAVVKEGRFVRARRWADEATAPDGWKRHTVAYEAESREALERYLKSDVVAKLREEYQARFGTTTRLSRQILVEEGTPIRGTLPE